MDSEVIGKPPIRNRSMWVNVAARVAITLLAAGSFLLLRQDYWDPIGLAYRYYIASPGIISAYLKQNSVRKLQIGAGPNNFTGWLNTDYTPIRGQAYLDATAPFPLPTRVSTTSPFPGRKCR